MKISDILPKVLAESPAWSELMEVMDQVVGETAEHRINAMANQRNMDYIRNIVVASEPELGDTSAVLNPDANEADRIQADYTGISYVDLSDDALEHLARIATFIGYSYRDDGVLTAEDYYRFIDAFSSFLPYAGTNLFVEFFSFLIGGNVGLDNMWLDLADRNLYPENDPHIIGRRASVDGNMEPDKNVVPTPYVNVLYPLQVFRIEGVEAQDRLFYSAAPIHLVVNDRITDITFDTSELRLHMASTSTAEYVVNFEPLETHP